VVKKAVANGIMVIVTTQCTRGSVSLNDYAVGRSLAEVGAVPGGDMTTEAVTAKLGFLYGLGFDNSRVKQEMTKSIRGEITPVVDGVAQDTTHLIQRSMTFSRADTHFIVNHE